MIDDHLYLDRKTVECGFLLGCSPCKIQSVRVAHNQHQVRCSRRGQCPLRVLKLFAACFAVLVLLAILEVNSRRRYTMTHEVAHLKRIGCKLGLFHLLIRFGLLVL